jgi:dihydroorotase
LKGGHVIDPKTTSTRAWMLPYDEDRSSRRRHDPAQARRLPDVEGLDVRGWWISMHVFHTTGIKDAWAGDNIPPDAFSFRTGITTMVDAGSSLAQLRRSVTR